MRVRDAAPDDTVRAMVTELAVEPIMRRAVDDVYAGNVLVQVRRMGRGATGPRRPGPAGPALHAAATPPSWPPYRTSCGSSSSTTRRCAGREPLLSEQALTSTVSTRSRTGRKKSSHAPRGGDVSYSTLGSGT